MRSCEHQGYYDIPFEEKRKAAAYLWENEESLRKYLCNLRDLMMADPETRMTEDETPTAARIRAELFNVGLRGSELIAALRKRLILEGME
jgi:hypothetical protein